MTEPTGTEANGAARVGCPILVDVSKCKRMGMFYVLDTFIEGADYRDEETGFWIWTIGMARETLVYRDDDTKILYMMRRGIILASTTPVFYKSEDFTCLWRRT